MSDTRHKSGPVSRKKRVLKKGKTARNRRHPLNKSVVFVDNNREFWNEDMVRLSSAVDYVYVPCNNKDENSDKEWLYAKSLAKRGNLYAIASAKHKFRIFPPNHGINPKIAERLKKWANTSSAKIGPLTALFDWDRTISCVEGIATDAFAGPMENAKNNVASLSEASAHARGVRGFSPKVPAAGENGIVDEGRMEYPSKEFLDDMFVYLIRASRIPMIKDLFRELRARGVDIRIVTNNLAASRHSPFRRIFLEMLARIFTTDPGEQCLGNYDSHERKEYEVKQNGTTVHIYEEYSAKSQVISAAELDAMLHSTVDYTSPNEPLNKSFAVCRMNPPIHAVRELCGKDTS